MAGKTDQIKGRVKKAAGELMGNQKLKDEGQADETAGKVKELVGNTVDKFMREVRKKN
ncbi:MAG TPA: CsbD family protein [Candidatus Omnitrophica bacterium]|nr:CsbD family protein [Candidatus Omnitrophota bacterium]